MLGDGMKMESCLGKIDAPSYSGSKMLRYIETGKFHKPMQVIRSNRINTEIA